MDPPADTVPLAVVAVKLPPFNAIGPELWFIQCKAQFGIKNITVDQSKYSALHLNEPLDK